MLGAKQKKQLAGKWSGDRGIRISKRRRRRRFEKVWFGQHNPQHIHADITLGADRRLFKLVTSYFLITIKVEKLISYVINIVVIKNFCNFYSGTQGDHN